MATPFQEAMRRRLMAIDDQGNAQTTWQSIAAQRDAQRKQQDEAFAWQKAYIDRMNMINATTQQIAGGAGFSSKPSSYELSNKSGGDTPFERFINSISKKESNNRLS